MCLPLARTLRVVLLARDSPGIRDSADLESKIDFRKSYVATPNLLSPELFLRSRHSSKARGSRPRENPSLPAVQPTPSFHKGSVSWSGEYVMLSSGHAIEHLVEERSCIVARHLICQHPNPFADVGASPWTGSREQ